MKGKHPIIFSDLDGTLLDHFSYQAQAAEQTLKQLSDVGIPVVLNTSKTFAESDVIRKELKLNTPFIVENGAAIYIPINTFNIQPLDTVKVGHYWVKPFCLERQHWLNLLASQCKEFHHDYRGFATLTTAELCQITGLELAQAERAKQRQYGEPIQWLGNSVNKAAFIKHIEELGATVVYGGRFMHIGGDCDKGQALTWLTKLYRKHFADNKVYTIALGDGDNDSSMLEVADIAVQIRSPVHEFPALKYQFKTFQSKKYGPEGWAEVIQDLLASQLHSHSL